MTPRRRARISGTSLFAGFFLLQSVSFADTEIRPSYRIAVSPLRAPQSLRRLSENVAVLDGEAIEGLPAHDPSEALTYVPGVDVTSRSKFGHFTPLSIQGSTSRHVLVVVDGIPFNTQASGQADILPMLPLGNVDRIEVVKGPASAAWGTALGGVVNVITREPSNDPLHGSVGGSSSGFGGRYAAFRGEGTARRVGWFVNGEYREAGGSRRIPGAANRDDTLRRSLFGKVVKPVSDVLKALFSYGFVDNEINEGVYPSDGTFNRAPYASRFGQARFDLDPGDSRHAHAAFQFNRQLIQVENFDFATDALFSRTRTRDNYYGGQFQYSTRPWDRDLFVAGYDVSNYVLQSTTMHVSRDVWLHAPYANYTLSVEPFDVKFGARHDFNGEYGDQFSPDAGIVYHVPGVHETLLRANVSRAFSAPPLLWKYFEDAAPGFTRNNPDLEPERAWAYSAGLETEAVEKWRFKFDVFRSDIRNAINTDVDGEGLFFKRNFEKFRQQGFAFESSYEICPAASVLFSSAFNDVEDRVTGLGVRNRGVTRPSFRLAFDYAGPQGLRAYLGGRYDRWDSSPGLQPNDRKWIVDGRLSRKWERFAPGVSLTCFLNAYNLTNSKYWSDRDFPLPQRYFEGGLTIEF